MKRYQNVSDRMRCVVFETKSQFLYRGQFIESDENTVSVPKGIIVTDLTPPKEAVVEAVKEEEYVVVAPVKKAPSRKKKTINKTSGD